MSVEAANLITSTSRTSRERSASLFLTLHAVLLMRSGIASQKDGSNDDSVLDADADSLLIK